VNWLAHLLLADEDVEHRVGNLIADWVKGAARAQFSAGIQRGFASHRQIDLYTDAHPVVARSRARIEAPFKRYAAVLVDVFYDHFLAVDWLRYCAVPFERWTRDVYRQFAAHWQHLPEPVQAGLRRMVAEDWLGAYATPEGIALTLARMSRRLSRPNLLGAAASELCAHYAELRSDFHLFFPQLQAHVRAGVIA